MENLVFLSHNERDLEVRKAFSEKVTSQQRMTRYVGIQQDKHGGVGPEKGSGGGKRVCRAAPGQGSAQHAPGAEGPARLGWQRGSGKK